MWSTAANVRYAAGPFPHRLDIMQEWSSETHLLVFAVLGDELDRHRLQAARAARLPHLQREWVGGAMVTQRQASSSSSSGVKSMPAEQRLNHKGNHTQQLHPHGGWHSNEPTCWAAPRRPAPTLLPHLAEAALSCKLNELVVADLVLARHRGPLWQLNCAMQVQRSKRRRQRGAGGGGGRCQCSSPDASALWRSTSVAFTPLCEASRAAAWPQAVTAANGCWATATAQPCSAAP